MCKQALQPKFIPIKCIKDECNQVVSIQDIIEFVEMKEIVPVAVEKLVTTHQDEFRYCVTPGCLNIFRLREKKDPRSYMYIVSDVENK